ncbi:MAG: hypothetical protein ACYSW8_19030 [Planctomycetota bacterium]|jgi:hypothetical protein
MEGLREVLASVEVMYGIAPLLAAALPSIISVGAPLVAGILGGKPKPSQASIEAGKKAESERALLDNRLKILQELKGFQGEFKPVLGKKGKPFIMRLPGVGGISSEQFTKKLRHMAGAIDFGQAKDIALLQSIAGLSQPGSNTSGTAVQGAAMAQERADQNSQGIASLLANLGGDIFGQTVAGGGPGLFPNRGDAEVADVAPVGSGIELIDLIPDASGMPPTEQGLA